MLEFLFELIFNFFGEFLLQLFTEALGGGFKAGWYKATGREHKLKSEHEVAWSVITGVLAGAATLYFFPELAIRWPALQLLNLLLAPTLAGVLVERLRAWREKRSEFSWHVFGYAALFGVAFAGTRWIFGH